MFAHEQLNVYPKTLEFAAKATLLSSAWNDTHAVVDHFRRAADSIVLNLADAARSHTNRGKTRTLDYAIGSSMECAGCLDVAQTKRLLTEDECYNEKVRLCEIAKMLIGLRKAWTQLTAREEPVPYQARPHREAIQLLFHHEKLDVYQTALSFIRWFESCTIGQSSSRRFLRPVDEASTSVVLNIAESNGRYSELDRFRFLTIAEGAAVKAAAHLDLGKQKGILAQVDTGKEILRRILKMLSRM